MRIQSVRGMGRIEPSSSRENISSDFRHPFSFKFHGQFSLQFFEHLFLRIFSVHHHKLAFTSIVFNDFLRLLPPRLQSSVNGTFLIICPGPPSKPSFEGLLGSQQRYTRTGSTDSIFEKVASIQRPWKACIGERYLYPEFGVPSIKTVLSLSLSDNSWRTLSSISTTMCFDPVNPSLRFF